MLSIKNNVHRDINPHSGLLGTNIGMDTVQGLLVCEELFQYPISGSEKYQNEFSTPK